MVQLRVFLKFKESWYLVQNSQLKSEAFQEMLFKRIKYFLMPSSRCLSINRKSNRAPVISPT